MSGIGFSEMLMLAVIALIVVGPERLPTIARNLGKLSRQARNAWQGLQSELQSELQAELDLDHNRKIMQASQSDAQSTASAEQESASGESDAVNASTDAIETHPPDLPDSRRNEK